MTDYKVLYYPDFVPDTTWLRQILLLCDGVVRIVPPDVRPDDPDDLRRLQDALDGGLESVGPEAVDVAVEDGDRDRLGRAFRALAQKRSHSGDHIKLTISGGGRLAIADHVFVHDAKLSDFVVNELKRNGLLNESVQALAPERFYVVQQDASNLILAGLASRIAQRLGLDAITDKPMPFAYAALRGVPNRAHDSGAAEGALLASIAEVMIPAAVADVDLPKYREIRDSYGEIREAFKRLTSELAMLHRLARIGDATESVARVESVAREFEREYQEYRNSQFARTLTSWAPLCVGGALTVAGSLVNPILGLGMAVASVGIQVVEKWIEKPEIEHERVFNMLSGLRRDIVANSGIRELV